MHAWEGVVEDGGAGVGDEAGVDSGSGPDAADGGVGVDDCEGDGGIQLEVSFCSRDAGPTCADDDDTGGGFGGGGVGA